jgi:phenylacetate-coenzyme A ligase PaaK-like adenylate-forming protein
MRVTPLDPWIAGRTGSDAGASRAAVTDHQLGGLNDTLALVADASRFYRGRLPHRLASLDELGQLPFTTADDLRADPMGFVCGSQGRISRVVTLDTSGTTGPPKRVAFTTADQELTIDFFAVGMSTFTRPGDRVAILLPGETPGSVGDLLATALTRIGATAMLHGVVLDPDRSRQRLIDDKADVAVGIPTHMLAVARDPGPQPVMRSVLVSTDHLPDAIVETLETTWGCTVYDHYGMTEMGLGGGVECEARDGYHIREADMIFEVIDPATGEPVTDGHPGEVVFTTITRSGMPLIRYRTGDLSRLLSGTCLCGSVVKRLARVRSRLDGHVELAGHTLTMSQLDEVLFDIPGIVGFTAEVTADGLSIGVRTTGRLDPEPIRARLLDALPYLRGAGLRIGSADTSPPTAGKRRIFDVRNMYFCPTGL